MPKAPSYARKKSPLSDWPGANHSLELHAGRSAKHFDINHFPGSKARYLVHGDAAVADDSAIDRTDDITQSQSRKSRGAILS